MHYQDRDSYGRYVGVLAAVFVAIWLALAIRPFDRADWLLENTLVAVFAVVLLASRRHLPLSRISYTLIFVFLCLHEVGAHYTYALVPYDSWFEAWDSIYAINGQRVHDIDEAYDLLAPYEASEDPVSIIVRVRSEEFDKLFDYHELYLRVRDLKKLRNPGH